MYPGGVAAGMETLEAQEQIDISVGDIEEVVTRSTKLDAVGRLEVYAAAYFSRLLECMRGEFPVLAQTIGEDLFDQLVVGYLNTYPSRSYTLGRLGAKFARYLEENCPREDKAWADFMIDLARLEWTFNEVFDGPGNEQDALLTAEQLQTIAPEQWPHVSLITVPSLRLLQFSYPVSRFHGEKRKHDDTAIPEPCENYVAVSRREFIVRRIELTRAQFELLQQITEGQPVGAAIAHAAEFYEGNFDQFAAELQGWFRQWTVEQFFLRFQLP